MKMPMGWVQLPEATKTQRTHLAAIGTMTLHEFPGATEPKGTTSAQQGDC